METTQTMSNMKIEGETTSYDRVLRKAIAISAFLFPAFFIIAIIFDFLGDPVRRAAYSGLGWYAAVVVMVAIATKLKKNAPVLAFIATVLVFIGGMTQMSAEKVDMEQQLLMQLGFDIAWDTTIEVMPPIGFFGLTVLLWMIGMLLLGVGVMRTGVFPHFTGFFLIATPIAFFLYQGPGIVRPVTYVASAVCLTIAMLPIGLQFWQTE